MHLGIAQEDRLIGGGMRLGQGNHGDVLGGVRVAGLEGHVSRSAVYLVHKGLNRNGLKPGGSRAGAARMEGGCVRRASC